MGAVLSRYYKHDLTLIPSSGTKNVGAVLSRYYENGPTLNPRNLAAKTWVQFSSRYYENGPTLNPRNLAAKTWVQFSLATTNMTPHQFQVGSSFPTSRVRLSFATVNTHDRPIIPRRLAPTRVRFSFATTNTIPQQFHADWRQQECGSLSLLFRSTKFIPH